MRLPLNQVGSVNRVSKEVSRFEQEHERRPSIDEIVAEVDLPEEKVKDAMKLNGKHVSMDAPFLEGEDSSLLDVLPNEDSPSADEALDQQSLKVEVERALATLSERERNIISCFFGIDSPEMTLEEIADKFGLTRERVRQIKEKAIRHLRSNTKDKVLRSYLGQ